MTVGELKQMLVGLDDDATVCVPGGEWDHTEARLVEGPYWVDWMADENGEAANEPAQRKIVVLE